jgi:prophage DNA circulation protein
MRPELHPQRSASAGSAPRAGLKVEAPSAGEPTDPRIQEIRALLSEATPRVPSAVAAKQHQRRHEAASPSESRRKLHGASEAQVRNILSVVQALDRGESIEALIRQEAEALEPATRRSLLMVLDLALELHRCPPLGLKEAVTAPRVREPRYRKGTGRRPVSWADCIWQPTRLRGDEA